MVDDVPDFLKAFADTGAVRTMGAPFSFDSSSPLGRPGHLPGPFVMCLAMTPSVFLSLAPELDPMDGETFFDDLVLRGAEVHPPCLSILFEPDYGLEHYPVVVGHDGRHRMGALMGQGLGDVPVPVLAMTDLLPGEIGAERLSDLATACWSQDTPESPTFLVRGPLIHAAALRGAVHARLEMDALHEYIAGRA